MNDKIVNTHIRQPRDHEVGFFKVATAQIHYSSAAKVQPRGSQ